eukprot:Opistho-2@47446
MLRAAMIMTASAMVRMRESILIKHFFLRVVQLCIESTYCFSTLCLFSIAFFVQRFHFIKTLYSVQFFQSSDVRAFSFVFRLDLRLVSIPGTFLSGSQLQHGVQSFLVLFKMFCAVLLPGCFVEFAFTAGSAMIC